MENQTANLAVVSNNTFEATKAVNLHHYDISSALQTTLDFASLLDIFSTKIQDLIAHSGYVYNNDEFGLKIDKGIVTKFSSAYALKVGDMQLGNLKIMRHQRFEAEDIKLFESLLCCLIYPLKNATSYKQALSMAYTDPLTKTHNRTSFEDSLSREIKLAHRKSSHLSVIFLDIDHFKSVNDCYGHECGDIALMAVAGIIKEALRGCDMIFRYGGEEFVILLNDTDLDEAKIIAERIRENIANHSIAYGMDILKLTASLGISTLRGNDSPELLVKRADSAMYQAKAKGRNLVQTESLVQLV